MLKMVIITLGFMCLSLSGEFQIMAFAQSEEPTFENIEFKITPAKGIGLEKGVLRRDPSDVIRVGDTYYIWYTKAIANTPLYPSGYFGEVWYATSKNEGHTWTEQGLAVGKGKGDAFDSHGVFTPNILAYKNKYYLYYTAVQNGFLNKGYTEIGKTRIGVAVADSPKGPWKKTDKNIVLEASRDQKKFDSYRVDDACMLIREGKIWMYYKGRQWKRTPGETKMGVAVAENPLGPFKRMNDGNPVQLEGHEVQIWALGDGVVSFVSNVGRGFYYSKDGLKFKKLQKSFKGNALAPGAFRNELTDHTYNNGVVWGISMKHGKNPYLVRWNANGLTKNQESQSDEKKN